MKLNLATLAVAFGAFSIAFAADAPVVANNPVSAQYLAKMPAGGDQGVDAQFAVMSGPGGEGVLFTININGKVFEGGPFRKSLWLYMRSYMVSFRTKHPLTRASSLPHPRPAGASVRKLYRDHRPS
jgi:hypothetical protein